MHAFQHLLHFAGGEQASLPGITGQLQHPFGLGEIAFGGLTIPLQGVKGCNIGKRGGLPPVGYLIGKRDGQSGLLQFQRSLHQQGLSPGPVADVRIKRHLRNAVECQLEQCIALGCFRLPLRRVARCQNQQREKY